MGVGAVQQQQQQQLPGGMRPSPLSPISGHDALIGPQSPRSGSAATPLSSRSSRISRMPLVLRTWSGVTIALGIACLLMLLLLLCSPDGIGIGSRLQLQPPLKLQEAYPKSRLSRLLPSKLASDASAEQALSAAATDGVSLGDESFVSSPSPFSSTPTPSSSSLAVRRLSTELSATAGYGVSPVLTFESLHAAPSFCLLPAVEHTWRFDQAFYDRVYLRTPEPDEKQQSEQQRLQERAHEWAAVEQHYAEAASAKPASGSEPLQTIQGSIGVGDVCERQAHYHFTAHVGANRRVYVQNCTRRNENGQEEEAADTFYSLEHGHPEPPHNSVPTFRSGELHLPDGASFVYVYCATEREPPAEGEKEGKLRPLLLHALQRVANPPSPPTTPRRHIFVLQLDALSHERFPLLMPRTHRMLQRMQQKQWGGNGVEEREAAGEWESAGAQRQEHSTREAASSSDLPQRSVALEFVKFNVVGHNSKPHLSALIASRNIGDLEDVPHEELLWNRARAEGYVTAMGDNECGEGEPIASFGFDIRQAPPKPGAPHPDPTNFVDHNLAHLFCTQRFQPTLWAADPPRCMLGRPAWHHGADALMQMIALYEDSPNPLFMWFNFNEAHEETGMAARHMDDGGFDQFLARLLGSRFMRHALFLLMSDHGLHFGHHRDSTMAGLQEHARPMLYIMQDSDALTDEQRKRQRSNAQQLVTSFDLHATLRAEIEGRPVVPPPKSIDLLRSAVPRSRICEQTRMPTSGVDDSRQLSNRCQCETPFTQRCPKPRAVQPNLWHQCTQLWSHPLIFDAEWYGLHSGAGPFPSPCAALYHWCQFGIFAGLAGNADFNPLMYQKLNIELQEYANMRLDYVRYYIEHAEEEEEAEIERSKQQQGGRRRLRTREELEELIEAHTQAQQAKLLNASSASDLDADAAAGDYSPHPDLLVIMEQFAASRKYFAVGEHRRHWLEAVARVQMCADSGEKPKAHSTAAGEVDVPEGRSLQRRGAAFFLSAMQHLFSWCIFDETQSELFGWHLTGRGCFRPFGPGDTDNDCVANYKHLKDPTERDNTVSGMATRRV